MEAGPKVSATFLSYLMPLIALQVIVKWAEMKWAPAVTGHGTFLLQHGNGGGKLLPDQV
jgi:hypothetical protein